jgi:hypothetical protein
MRKSKFISLVLVGTALIGLSSCHHHRDRDNLYIRGSAQDDYTMCNGGFHVFYPIVFYTGIGYGHGGYTSNSFHSTTIHNSAYGRSGVSRGGFGSSSHSVSS